MTSRRIAPNPRHGGFCLTRAEGTTEPAIALFEALQPDEIVFPDLLVLVFTKAGFYLKWPPQGGG